LKQFGSEFIDMFKQPVKWNTKDWLTLGGIAGGTIAFMQFDESVRSETLKDRNYETSFPIVFGDTYGEGWGSLLIGTGFLAHGILKEKNANKRFGFEVLQAFAYAGTITGLLKFTFGRSRPYMDEGAFSYHPVQMFSNDYFSFPSLHTTVAFSLSTVLSEQTNSTALKIISFVPAVMTAFARVYYDKHWVSDVFLGAAVGYFVGKFVINQHKRENSDIRESSAQNYISILIPF
ncbi:MAG: hypothetical protein A2V66_07375, partial [Ignavibacteria bacterium RBG_13_36_8]